MNTYNLRQLHLNNDDENEDDDEDQAITDNKNTASLWLKKQEALFFKNRTIYLWGPVEDRSAKEIVNKLLLLDADKPGKEIKLFINSPGGVVSSGMVIYDVMKLIKSPVTTICMGLAASMGSILLSAGQKGKRAVFPNGEVMIHQPSLGGYFQGVSADLEIQAKQIQKTKELGAKILSENCNQPYEKVLGDLERDYWMDAKEAMEYGIVDKIIDKL